MTTDDYAIVQTGGKQYRVHEGDTIRVESLVGESGDNIEFDDVLLVSRSGDVTLGSPTVVGAKVKADVVGKGRGKKVVVLKYKNKTRYRRRLGHRQAYTDLKITNISLRKKRKAKAQ
ncbi:MAG: 50S ribosomal protein L21 [SAR202 cluster bacterium]|jgi:large subunit ribosomal protein L21|nr:50S ribosomal protein L21 [SAR202 cluster bacterium]